MFYYFYVKINNIMKIIIIFYGVDNMEYIVFDETIVLRLEKGEEIRLNLMEF